MTALHGSCVAGFTEDISMNGTVKKKKRNKNMGASASS